MWISYLQYLFEVAFTLWLQIESTSVSLKVPPVTLPEVKTIHDSKQMSHEKISLVSIWEYHVIIDIGVYLLTD